jgi:hypothetical protein
MQIYLIWELNGHLFLGLLFNFSRAIPTFLVSYKMERLTLWNMLQDQIIKL